MGYNTEAILLTIKTAVNWKDCYKNLFYTLFDFQNWVGPKALYIDFCDFHTDEDFLLYSWNPGNINTATGDVTMLYKKDSAVTYGYDGTTIAANTMVKRPNSGDPSFYRDCFVLDDLYLAAGG